ncbi:unnamed protein product [Strongylus vulgaris]|uniref:Uncharacterized protein n=1 Tax=Strongylus vulgaris TaxID=40348 RepID=A0A3P7KVX1_STRVU|nr:unnamed protein product [Strongylus vulgaris]
MPTNVLVVEHPKEVTKRLHLILNRFYLLQPFLWVEQMVRQLNRSLRLV